MDSVYKLKVVGGLNFTERKCIFSLDGKLLLTIATNCILIFVVDDGSPYGTLTITSDENKSSRKSSYAEDICNIVLNPYSPESSVISFTNRGRITFWNYLKVNQIKEFNIFTSLYPDIQSSLTLLYGLVVKPENDDDNISDLTIYHATLFCDKPYLYYCTIGQIEQITKSCVSKDKPRKTKAGSQVSFDRLKSMATNIRYDPDRALVGIVTGARNKFLAAIEGNFINIIHLPYSTSTGGIAHKQARNFFTCLTAHPTEYLLAAGDSLGRVHIYREDFCFSHQPIRSITHWHHSPVADLCFSPSGSYLYSGGFESVLVRWDISFSHENNFYPRLGSPIRYVICDSLNQKILTCHENNTFHCVGSTFDVNFPALGGLTLLPPTDFLRAPQNISWDPKSSSIVLRGKCGHLQFYSPFKEQQLFQLDVVGMNYLPPEVDRVIINVDVARFCVSSNGEWISTLEYREDGVMMPEMRLKFWQYLDSSENKYKLNSCIHLPHKKPVNRMKFSQDSNFMVTTSRDTEFKIWHLVKEDSGKPDGKTYWICGRVGNLNRFSTPEEIAVSSDFSLLAISFGSNVTIWDTSDYNLESRGTFVPPKDSHLNSIDQTILSIGFGSDIQTNLLFETRSSSVRVCDLLNYSVKQLWKPPKNTYIKFNLYDDQKNRMACYLTNGTIVLLDTEKEVAKITLSHDTADVRLMVCGIFFPLPRVSDDPIFSHHGIILIDQSQKVYAIGLSDNKVEELSLSGPIDDELEENLTPFARMCKEERYKVKKEEKLKQLELNQYLGPSITRKKLIEDVFIKVSSHILPPVEKFCTSFLTSLLQLSSSNSSNDNVKEIEKYSDAKASDNSSDEEIDEKSKGKETNDQVPMEVDNFIDEKPEFVFNENYDWLKD